MFLNRRPGCMALPYLLTALMTLFSTEKLSSQEKVLDVGEELVYEVSYGFIKLGTLKYNLTSSHKEGKKLIYNARLEIKTYPEVPFVKLNDIFESEMEITDEKIFTDQFYETNFRERSISRTDCRFDYKKGNIKFRKETDGNIESDKMIKIDGVETSVKYSFNFNKSVVKIEKFPYDISIIKMEGTADYTGFFGFKGEFLMMLSDDEQRVPVKAYFNSTLGNVVLELISYKKNKWTPPAYLK